MLQEKFFIADNFDFWVGGEIILDDVIFPTMDAPLTGCGIFFFVRISTERFIPNGMNSKNVILKSNSKSNSKNNVPKKISHESVPRKYHTKVCHVLSKHIRKSS